MAKDQVVPATRTPPVPVCSEELLEVALAQLAATRAVQAELVALREDLRLDRLARAAA